MAKLFDEFERVTKQEWSEKMIADLKGKDPVLLEINDEIEDLHLSSYYHEEDRINNDQLPGNYPYLRGANNDNNDWENGALISVMDESAANKEALVSLNLGASLLVFKANKGDINWSKVLDKIELDYIQTQFVISSIEDFDNLKEILSIAPNIMYNIDPLDSGLSETSKERLFSYFKEQQQPFLSVNGFKIQRAGGNTWQEIAFCLSTGHTYLGMLLDKGFSIDDAAACISFKIGIGSNYFLEIAKIRALKKCWAKIIHEYNPTHGCSHNCRITAVTGSMNKSLKDPYTNLLRQTTEVMAAVNAGSEAVVVLPYDDMSVSGASSLSKRMALNISLILKEEAYLDKVTDSLGGSYSVEKITESIGRKAWNYFQELESLGSIISEAGLNNLKEAVQQTVNKRIKNLVERKDILIGINKFNNPDPVENEWGPTESYLGMPQLILENEFKSVEHE